MTETTTAPASPGNRAIRAILGLLLVLPAAGACLLTFFIPSLRLVTMSFQKVSVLGGGASEWVDMENYAHLDEVSGGAISMTLLVLGVRLIAVLIIPPLLALGISHSTPVLKIGARLFLTIPVALFAPFLALSAWLLTLRPEPAPGSLRSLLLLADGVITLTLACAVTLPAYLAALNTSDDETPGGTIHWRPLAIIWLVSLLAVVALSPQAFAISYITQGGPVRSTETAMLLIYRQAFQRFQFGPAAALSTLLLMFIMPMGLIAGAVAAWSGLGIRTVSTGAFDRGSNVRANSLLIGIGMLLLAAVCGLLAGLPYAAQVFQPAAPGSGVIERVLDGLDLASALSNTVFPQIFGVLLVQLPLTYLAALGIGGVRPFGRRSELLLLPFSPWLFVTVGPLLIVFFMAARETGTVNTIAVLLPRFAISIPILFILTLFFKGQEAKRQEYGVEDASTLGDFFRTVILPSLPLVLLLGAGAVLVGMQTIEWPLVAVSKPDQFTIPVMVAHVSGAYGLNNLGLGMLLIMVEAPIFVASLLTFAVFQVFYLPRLSLTRQGSPSVTAEPDHAETGLSTGSQGR